MRAFEIAQQRDGERDVLEHHGDDACGVIVRGARPSGHARDAVLGCAAMAVSASDARRN